MRFLTTIPPQRREISSLQPLKGLPNYLTDWIEVKVFDQNIFIFFAWNLQYRWDEKAAEQLPANLREVYKNIICDTNEIVEELKILNNKNAELVIKVVSTYNKDNTKW